MVRIWIRLSLAKSLMDINSSAFVQIQFLRGRFRVLFLRDMGLFTYLYRIWGLFTYLSNRISVIGHTQQSNTQAERSYMPTDMPLNER